MSLDNLLRHPNRKALLGMPAKSQEPRKDASSDTTEPADGPLMTVEQAQRVFGRKPSAKKGGAQ